MKLKLTLEKIYEIDIDKERDSLDGLIEALQSMGVEGDASPDDIHDAIRYMLEDDVESVIFDLDIDVNDFKIEVPEGTTVTVPESISDED